MSEAAGVTRARRLRELILAVAILFVGPTCFAHARSPFDEAMARGEAAFAEGTHRVARAAFEQALGLAADGSSRARATTGIARAWWRSDPPTWRGDNNGSRHQVRPNRDAPRLLLSAMAMTQHAALAQMAETGVGPDEAAYAEAVAWLNLMHAEARSLGWPALLRPSERPVLLALELDSPLCDSVLVIDPRPDYPEEAARDWRSGAIVMLVETTADNRLLRLDVAGSAGPDSFMTAVSSVMEQWTTRPIEADEDCSRAGVQFVQITFARRNGASLGLEFGSDWFAPRSSRR